VAEAVVGVDLVGFLVVCATHSANQTQSQNRRKKPGYYASGHYSLLLRFVISPGSTKGNPLPLLLRFDWLILSALLYNQQPWLRLRS